MTQENGSKRACIARLLETGYPASSCPDGRGCTGDLKAAKDNGVLFYPILAGHEKESWEAFEQQALEPLLRGEYGDGRAQEEAFWNNLRELEKHMML